MHVWNFLLNIEMMKTIKFDRQVTTPEQSDFLLKLGLPIESADFHFDWDKNTHYATVVTFGYDRFSKPCWSSGRLIEILEICTGCPFTRTQHPDVLGDAVGQVEHMVKEMGLDFSKLENTNPEVEQKHYTTMRVADVEPLLVPDTDPFILHRTGLDEEVCGLTSFEKTKNLSIF